MSEEPNIEFHEQIPEPGHSTDEASKKVIELKGSVVVDYASYQCNVKEIVFKPTLMYSQ